MDSNSARKLPSPNPCAPFRWMISKKIGPMTGRVKICVKGPTGAKVCHSFRLLKSGSLYQAKARWAKSYPNQGRGTYRVTFFYGSTKLGPALSFRVP